MEEVEIPTQDWYKYSAECITNNAVGILHKVNTDIEFYMIKRIHQPDHNNGTPKAVPKPPFYVLTKFTEYTVYDRVVLGTQCFIISPQVYCQCMYPEQKVFQEPFISSSIEKSNIAFFQNKILNRP
jgi:hypothetical protein